MNIIPLLSKVLKDITTTANGETFDVIRIGTMIVTLAYMGLEIANIVALKQPFNAAEFGTGIAAVYAAAGAAIGMKKGDEPNA